MSFPEASLSFLSLDFLQEWGLGAPEGACRALSQGGYVGSLLLLVAEFIVSGVNAVLT